MCDLIIGDLPTFWGETRNIAGNNLNTVVLRKEPMRKLFKTELTNQEKARLLFQLCDVYIILCLLLYQAL